ncbi:MAG: sodium:proton antiporter [Chitinophagaceae bacterium]|nr:MAG: sodium:proton antiporter [Chitinophagaceae bacterium]
MHLPNLIVDLGLILGAAAIMTLLFKKLKQPLVLGYIIAGILVSPHFKLFPSVIETANVQVWADMGVIFLLFSLGLEFSFKKLAQVGGSASVSAVIDAVVMAVIGYFTGQALGWPVMDRVFLGAMLAVSSTTIIIKAIDELGFKKKKFATLVFGILIVEDLITIAIIVLLSTYAVSQQFVGTEMVFAILKLIFFLVLWFLLGIFFIPTLLKKARHFMNDEMLLIISIAMCLGMVYLASRVGFSPALGAFVMGSMLAETTKAEKIEHLINPVKDLFGAVFFVSVGILIDLSVIVEYIYPIISITLVIIIGKTLSLGTGAFISGQPLKTSIQTGMSMAVIGEFSFIIAGLGLSLNATSQFLYPIIVAVSGITTFTTPYLIKLGEPTYNWINNKLPERWKTDLLRYSSEAHTITSVSDWQKTLKSFIMNMVLFSVILVAIIFLSARYALPFVEQKIANVTLGFIVTILLTLTLMAPFLWGLVVRNERNEFFAQIYAQRKYKGPIWLMRGVKMAFAIFFVIFFINRFFSIDIALYAAVIIISSFIIFRRNIQALYDRIENRFILNLNDRELQQQVRDAEIIASQRNVAMAPWDAHMVTFDVASESSVAGKSLIELQWRELIGANIAKIQRGAITKLIPGRDDRIFPGDKLFVICTDAQEKKLNALLRPSKLLIKREADTEVVLDKFTIEKESPLLNKNIRESIIKTDLIGLVVGVEREGERILNPESSLVFREADVVWIVGDKKKMDKIEHY